VVLVSGRVLLVRNERGEWELPGGKLELGEEPSACVAREIKEEVDWDVDVGPVLDVWVYTIVPSRVVFVVMYGCHKRTGSDDLTSPEGWELGLFAMDELDDLALPDPYRRAIRRWADRTEHPTP